MKKRILVIGPSDENKIQLINKLEGINITRYGSQDLKYTDEYIYIPSGYLTIPWMYGHIITIAQNQGCGILLLIDEDEKRHIYPPEFAKSFNCTSAGIVIGKSKENAFAKKQLEKAGIRENLFSVDIKEENEEVEKLVRKMLGKEKQ